MLQLSATIISDFLTLILANAAAKPWSAYLGLRSDGANATVSPGNNPEPVLKTLPRLRCYQFKSAPSLWLPKAQQGHHPRPTNGDTCTLFPLWLKVSSSDMCETYLELKKMELIPSQRAGFSSCFHQEWWMCFSTVWKAANGAGRYVRQQAF